MASQLCRQPSVDVFALLATWVLVRLGSVGLRVALTRFASVCGTKRADHNSMVTSMTVNSAGDC